MTFRRYTPDEIQYAVNVAAREMTAATPSPELRAAVLSRIAASQPRWGWGWRVAFAGGAIGAAALTAAVMWPAHTVSTPGALDIASMSSAAMGSAIATSAVTPEFVSATDVVIVPMPLRSEALTVSASELDWRERAVPALAEPDALHVAPMRTNELTVAPIDIAPLTVPPLSAAGTTAGGAK